jgi:phospholipid/cholesterol/gamma-HCH transport system ATP-binding protein
MIRIEQLSKSFGPKRVLAGIDLEIADGENLVILGRSGTGKSVLLKHIVGLLMPDAGRVVVDGQVVHELEHRALDALRARIGYVFQFAALFDSMTVAENLALGLQRRGLDGDEIAARTAEALRLVRLEGSDAKFPAELSGGMRKRVGIARAIALRPKYILYDEPTSGLDPVTSAVIDRLMVRTRELGVTGVIVTHDMKSAFTVGDRLALLHEGRVHAIGTPDEMRASADPLVRRFVDGIPDEEAA